MGWTQYRESVPDPKAECDRLHDWERNGEGYHVLDSALVGNVYYAATQERGDGKPVEAVVCLISLSPFGYKSMTESMGPNEDKCPLHVLEKLTPLPAPDFKRCNTCEGTGKLCGPHIRAERHGATCYICEGTGEVERHAYARKWRKRCWDRFGGEPQGTQLELLA